ncbi:MAG TPA: ferric reductase-like transmembrane domain-containing protein [Ktedonobacterales bacterium]
MDHLTTLAAVSQSVALVWGHTRAGSSTLLWYITRATAVAAYVTLSVSVTLGVIQSIGRVARERLPWLVDETHHFISTLTGVLALGHLTALYFDPYLPFSLLNLIAPINEPYRPLGVALGVFALYSLVALLFSSWLRRRMPYAFWRGVHFFSFIAFALVTAHGWLAGSDTQEPWMRGLYIGAAAAITFLLLMRLFTHPHTDTGAA